MYLQKDLCCQQSKKLFPCCVLLHRKLVSAEGYLHDWLAVKKYSKEITLSLLTILVQINLMDKNFSKVNVLLCQLKYL